MEQISTMVTDGGRIVIPAEFRRRMGIEIGDKVTVIQMEGELRIITQKEALRRIQQKTRKLAGDKRSLVDEFIAERREEADSE